MKAYGGRLEHLLQVLDFSYCYIFYAKCSAVSDKLSFLLQYIMQVLCIIGWLLQKSHFVLYFLSFLNKLTEFH